jgi:hypothetical protein
MDALQLFLVAAIGSSSPRAFKSRKGRHAVRREDKAESLEPTR